MINLEAIALKVGYFLRTSIWYDSHHGFSQVAQLCLFLQVIILIDFSIPNPKQGLTSIQGRATWYPYYAGFCPEFAEQILTRVDIERTGTVLDPWNGAGTTTQIASDLGYRAIGFDVNPAVVHVAKSRLLAPSSSASLSRTLSEIVQLSKKYRIAEYYPDDPLYPWFDEPTTTSIRHIQRAIHEHFRTDSEFELNCPPSLSRQACFFYTVLFRVLREAVAGFRASNPTWLKIASYHDERLQLARSQLIRQFEVSAQGMILALRKESPQVRQHGHHRISVASSLSLPIGAHEVDLVLASPPYCTRIDYAVSTVIELALLGISGDSRYRDLRDSTTGTSTIRGTVPEVDPSWGTTCVELLAAVKKHPSKASKSYYLKTLQQYFSDINISLSEIDRCLKPGGHCILVIQDSHYKDIYINLRQIVADFGKSLGWRVHQQRDFPVRRSMLGINTRSRLYRSSTSSTESVESVLWFTKSG